MNLLRSLLGIGDGPELPPGFSALPRRYGALLRERFKQALDSCPTLLERFSPQTIMNLIAGGWFPGRAVSPFDYLSQDLAGVLSPQAKRVLGEFGGVVCGSIRMVGDDWPTRIERGIIQQVCGLDLCAIGQANAYSQGENEERIWISQSGMIFYSIVIPKEDLHELPPSVGANLSGDTSFLMPCAASFDQAIELLGRSPCASLDWFSLRGPRYQVDAKLYNLVVYQRKNPRVNPQWPWPWLEEK